VTQNFEMKQLDPADERWLAFAASIPRTNIFHHPVWVNLLAKCYGYHAFVIALSDETDRICAGLPFLDVNSFLTGRRWASLPFTDYSSPLAQDQNALAKLTRELVTLSQDKRTPPIEVRWELPALPEISSRSTFVQHTLDLNRSFEKITQSFHRTQRQNIRTAEKNCIRIERGQDLHALNRFYRLHCLTRRRQGVPVQPRRFFDLLQSQVIEKGLGFILLAYAGDQCLAAGLFLHWGETLTYKYAASSESGQELRPNHLLTATAIQWGCENGYKIFDFGRTEVANEGLRTFKNRWGAVESPLAYSMFSVKQPVESSGRLDALMHKIICKSPIWVCRLTGELFYRHFG
jgi:CelD/BcsL family acetyltransferase involved in cellulose biosynthesis